MNTSRLNVIYSKVMGIKATDLYPILRNPTGPMQPNKDVNCV